MKSSSIRIAPFIFALVLLVARLASAEGITGVQQCESDYDSEGKEHYAWSRSCDCSKDPSKIQWDKKTVICDSWRKWRPCTCPQSGDDLSERGECKIRGWGVSDAFSEQPPCTPSMPVVFSIIPISLGGGVFHITRIPDSIRTVTAYTGAWSRTLDRDIRADSAHLGLGVSISSTQWDFLSEFVWSGNPGEGGRGTIGEKGVDPWDEYVGYVLRGSYVNTLLGYRIGFGLVPKIGYRASFMTLNSGTDAYSRFETRYRTPLPDQGIIGLSFIPLWFLHFELAWMSSASFKTSPFVTSHFVILRIGIPFYGLAL